MSGRETRVRSWASPSFFCFKQKTAYEMRISDWSSDVCSSDLGTAQHGGGHARGGEPERPFVGAVRAEQPFGDQVGGGLEARGDRGRAERRQRRGEQRFRSGERRGGNECVSTCRSRGAQDP